ncbi:MAG: 2-oxoacid:acceptor oxidoreductase family protein [Campylobacteraceae bacterium]
MHEIIWYGRGGQGAFTAARLLGISAVNEGLFALAFPTFGPERRGAPVSSFTKIGKNKILDRSESKSAHFAIVLDESLFSDEILKNLRDDGVLIINTKDGTKYKDIKQEVISLDANALALEILKKPIVNTALLGAFIAKFDLISLKSAKDAISDELKPIVAQKNIELLEKVYKRVKNEKA